jgi:hypothetical protein
MFILLRRTRGLDGFAGASNPIYLQAIGWVRDKQIGCFSQVTTQQGRVMWGRLCLCRWRRVLGGWQYNGHASRSVPWKVRQWPCLCWMPSGSLLVMDVSWVCPGDQRDQWVVVHMQCWLCCERGCTWTFVWTRLLWGLLFVRVCSPGMCWMTNARHVFL